MVVDHSISCSISELHQKLWPYAQNQLLYQQILCGRFQGLKVVLSQHSEFFATVKKVQKSAIHEYVAVSKSICRHGERLGSMATALTSPVARYAERCSEQHKEFLELLTNSALKEVQLLNKQVGAKLNIYRETLNGYTRELVKIREKAVASIQRHENVLAKKPFMDEYSGTLVYRSDPWISEQQLRRHLNLMIQQENSFEHQLQTVIQDMVSFDRETLCKLVRIWDLFTKEKAAHWSENNHTAEFGALEPFLVHEFKNSFSDYVLLHQSMLPLCTLEAIATAPPDGPKTLNHIPTHKLGDFAYQTRNIGILAQDVVYRRGTIRRSKWKPCYLVLTQTGFLHLFSIPKESVDRYLELRKLPTSLEAAIKADAFSDAEVHSLERSLIWSIFLGKPGVTLRFESNVADELKESAVVRLSTAELHLCALPNGQSFKTLLSVDQDSNGAKLASDKSTVGKLFTRTFGRRQKREEANTYEFKTLDATSRLNWLGIIQETVNLASTSSLSNKLLLVEEAGPIASENCPNRSTTSLGCSFNAHDSASYPYEKSNGAPAERPDSQGSSTHTIASFDQSIESKADMRSSVGTAEDSSGNAEQSPTHFEAGSDSLSSDGMSPPDILDHSPAYKSYLFGKAVKESQLTLDNNETQSLHEENVDYKHQEQSEPRYMQSELCS